MKIFPICLLLVLSITIYGAQRCPENQFYDSTATACAACDSSCLYCSDSTASDCLACPSGKYLSAGACVSTCPTGYIADVTSRRCTICFENCQACPSSWFIYKSYCVDACPTGTTTSGSTCNPPASTSHAPIIVPRFEPSSTVSNYQTLTFTPYIDSAFSATYAWTTTDSTLLSGVTVNDGVLTIPPTNLIAGTTYSIVLTVSNSIGSNTVTYDFTTASALVGSISVSPSSGIVAMITPITFTLSGFDTNEPVYYDVVATFKSNINEDSKITAKISGTTINLDDALVISKGLTRSEVPSAIRFPPIDSDRDVTIWLFAYNTEKMVVSSQNIRVSKQTQSSLSSLSDLQSMSSAIEIAITAKALTFDTPKTEITQCTSLSIVTNMARKLSGSSFCDASECFGQGACNLFNNVATCSCFDGYVGNCCEVKTSSVIGLSSGTNLYSLAASQLSSYTISASNAGYVANALDSISTNVAFLRTSDISSMISLLQQYAANTKFINRFIAAKLFNAVNKFASYIDQKFSGPTISSQLATLYSLQNTIINAAIDDLQFKESISLKDKNQGFTIKKDYSALVLGSGNSRLLQFSIAPTQVLSNTQINDLDSSVIIPSFSLKAGDAFTSISYFTEENLISQDVSTVVASFGLKDQNGNSVSEFVGQTISAVLKKNIASNYTYTDMWTCVQDAGGSFSESGCSKTKENFTHILCSCTASSSIITITAIVNSEVGYVSKECVMEPFLLYQNDAEYDFADGIIDTECSPFRFNLNGVWWTITFILFIPIWLTFVKKVTKDINIFSPYNENLSFFPWYSIFKAPPLPYDSKLIRANYFLCHITNLIGAGMFAGDQAMRLNVNYYWFALLNGTFECFVLQYGTAAFWNYLYKREYGPDYVTKKVPQRARYVIIVLCYLFWIGYFIGRWGVQPTYRHIIQVFGGLLLVGADLLFFDPLVAILAINFKPIREFVKFRGYYVPKSKVEIVKQQGEGPAYEPAKDVMSVRSNPDNAKSSTAAGVVLEDVVIGDPRTPDNEARDMREIISDIESPRNLMTVESPRNKEIASESGRNNIYQTSRNMNIIESSRIGVLSSQNEAPEVNI